MNIFVHTLFATVPFFLAGQLFAADDSRVAPLSSCYSDVLIEFAAKQNGVTVEVARDAMESSPETFLLMYQAAQQTIDLHDKNGDVGGQFAEIDSQMPGTSSKFDACYQKNVVDIENTPADPPDEEVYNLDTSLRESATEEDKKGAEIACLKLANTTEAQHLERIEIIMDFGIVNPSLAQITKHLVEIGFSLNQDSCVDNLLDGLMSPLNK